ncbi:MAG: phosphoenolpyruvate--protein phosphotransferase [Nitrospinae bacterium]|nr:phosphoenolpyruvate--protein phosphotransferase [Nitrospinota bacterium]
MIKLAGIGASRGIAIGKIYLLDRSRMCVLKYEIRKDEINKEIQRFKEAVAESTKYLNKIKEKAKKNLDSKFLGIMNGHMMILQDDLLVSETIDRIKNERINAEWVFQKSMKRLRNIFLKMDDEYLRERGKDIDHVGNLILRNLIGHDQESIADLNEKAIIVSRDLAPSDVVQMKKDKVLGFVTEAGGKTSHVSIMAASFEIPAVVGLNGIIEKAGLGDSIIVDGIEGVVIINPTKEEFKHYLKKRQIFEYHNKELLKIKDLKAETTDGFSVKLMANIETNLEIPLAKRQGAQGVGLFRTECLFLNRQDLPSEEEHFQIYKETVESFAPHPVIIRTLDAGGDKIVPQLNKIEANPALGLRAIRYSLKQLNIFKEQLRAILRAGHFGNIKIMYPLISGLEEIQKANEILEEVKEDLSRDGIPFKKNIEIGIMIETPSAAVIADVLAHAVDFFSIGTNDLIQYVLAVDRTNEMVASLYQPLHPSVLRLIQLVLKSAEKANIEVSVCGSMGGNPLSALILLGLGKIDSMSMYAHSLPKIKKMIRNVSLKDAKDISSHILTLSSFKEINDYVSAEVPKRFSDDMNFADLN